MALVPDFILHIDYSHLHGSHHLQVELHDLQYAKGLILFESKPVILNLLACPEGALLDPLRLHFEKGLDFLGIDHAVVEFPEGIIVEAVEPDEILFEEVRYS